MDLETRLFGKKSSPFFHRRERTFPGWFVPHLRRRRVNDNPRRFHSEPRRVSGNQSNGGSFPTPSQKGYLVSNGISNNHRNGQNLSYNQPRDGRRLQSLPTTKPKADEVDHRQIKSAPNNEAFKGQGQNSAWRPPPPAPPRSRVADNDPGKDLHQVTHGKATKAYEVKYLKSNRFASSWAQVRADNPAFNDMSPNHSPAKGLSRDHQSPDSITKTHSTRDSSPSNHDDYRKDQKKALRKQSRGRPPHKTRAGAKSRHTDENNNGESPKKYVSGDESDAIIDGEEKGSPKGGSKDRKISKKVEWNDSVVIPQYEKPPPKHISLRYLDSLTFKPAINSGKDVFQTYVSKDNKPVKDVNNELNFSFSDNEEGYDSSVNLSSSEDDGNDNSQERQKKEPFLNRREARKYIKMTNVYGSDAYKNQRKEWFVQKIAEMQEAKAKFKAEQDREEKKKRLEDMKRQKRQLNYVRKKFRKEQEHRFRTQYVTARVLEYEQVNRHMYGLPEDFLDLTNLLKGDDPDEQDASVKDEYENKENRLLAQDKINNKKSKSPKDSSPIRKGENKKKKSPDRNIEKRKKEEEALAKARENQKSWYAKTEPDRVSPSTDTRSHASHATSGYESEKGPSDHNGNLSHTEDNHAVRNNNVVKQFSLDDKQNVQKRLESQKNIYGRENVVRNKPPKPSHTNGVRKGTNTDAANLGKKLTNQPTTKPNTRLERKSDHALTKSEKAASSSGNQNTPEYDTAPDDNTRQRDFNPTQNALKQPASYTPSGSKVTGPTSIGNISQVEKGKSVNNKSDDSNKQNQSLVNSVNTANREEGSSNKGIIPDSNSKSTNANSGKGNENEKLKGKDKIQNTAGNRINPKSDNKKESSSHASLGATTSSLDQGNKTTENKTLDGKSSTDKKGDQKNTSDQKGKQTGAAKEVPLVKESPGEKMGTKEDNSIQRQPPASKSDSRVVNPRLSEHPESHNAQSSSSSSPQKPSSIDKSPSSHSNQRGLQHKDTDLKGSQFKSPERSSEKTGLVPKEKHSELQTDKGKHSSGSTRPQRVAFDDVPRQQQTRSGKTQVTSQNPPKKKESLADRMFNIKTGPTWDPQKKTPKMEGIDTVVLSSKDKKGRDVKKKKNVKDVVKEADNLLKVPHSDDFDKRSSAGLRRSQAVSPDVTLGSDFDVDDDDELMEDDIFERLRRKYNINIDSDEENDNL